MSDKPAAIVTRSDFQPVIDLVINGLGSENSRRAYRRSISEFMSWWEDQGRPMMTKALVQEYKVKVLDASGRSPQTINQRLAAIRKLAAEAADNGMIDQNYANGISKVKGVSTRGVRAGNWLTKDQAQRFINSPDVTTVKGLRDRAMIALMVGAGLRRSEVAALTFDHIQQREGRWVILDLVGKHERVRTVPIPSWCKAAVDAWAAAAGLSAGRVFRGVWHYGKSLQPGSEGISAQAVWDAVADAAYRAGLDVAPHDLRRTFAKLARKGGAELTQIQLTLGHANVATTQRYIGEDQRLDDAPCDRLGLDLSGD